MVSPSCMLDEDFFRDPLDIGDRVVARWSASDVKLLDDERVILDRDVVSSRNEQSTIRPEPLHSALGGHLFQVPKPGVMLPISASVPPARGADQMPGRGRSPSGGSALWSAGH